MNRVETAIREGRCVLAIGAHALNNPDVLGELRRRSVPAVHLGGSAVNPVASLSADNLTAVLNQAGGILVLVEPEAAADGKALSELGEYIKAASNKPKIFVAARAFNPFMMPMNMRLLKMEGLKFRAKDFIAALPVVEDAPAAPAPEPKKKKNELSFKAPRAHFVGRETEVSSLREMLGSPGGPIAVTGPMGIGKRWLVEYALTESEATRWPDLTFGPGVGADTLLARIASHAKAAGDDRLHKAILAPDVPAPAEIAALAAETLCGEGLAGAVWVIHGLDGLLDRRRSHFHGAGRLEMVLTAILSSQPTVSIILTTARVPELYNDGALADMRVIELGGLQGNLLHEVFEAHHAPEFPREHFGPISERTLGHPLAVRFLAITATEDGDIEELLEQKRFLKLEGLDRREAISAHIKRRIEKLDDQARRQLATCALFVDPATTDDLRVLGLDRKARLWLVSQGLLEQTPVDGARRYYVHPMVAKHLDYREVYDFDSMQNVGRHIHNLHKDFDKAGDVPAAIATAFEGNRLLVESRRERSVIQMAYPDFDALIHNTRSMMGRKKARLDIARSRVNSLLKASNRHSDLLLMNAELRAVEKASFELIVGAYNEAQRQGPTPDVYISEAALHTRTRARGKAARAMEKGVATFNQNGRLYRHLAVIYMDQNKLDEAIVLLKSAMTLEPMMPDTYGLLGEAYTLKGMASWDDALTALNEALGLDPENPRNLVRKAILLRDQALSAEEGVAEGLAAATEAVTAALEVDKGHPFAQELAAALILDQGGDVDQADWYIQQSGKRRETSFGLVQRARVMVRKQSFDEVERLINKALKREPSNHAAFAAQAEMWEAQGQIFHAFEAMKSAKERTPKESAARVAYDRRMTKLGALIESGAAAEMMKAAGLNPEEEQAAAQQQSGERRDPGTTTIRRPKKAAEGAEAAPAAEPEEVAAADVADVDAAAEPEEATTAAEPEEATTAAEPEEATTAAEPEEATTAAEPEEATTAAEPEEVAAADVADVDAEETPVTIAAEE
jgi:tetratricopeptide (TPR) repeat protein